MLRKYLFTLFIIFIVLSFSIVGFSGQKGLYFYKFDTGIKLLQIEQKTSMIVVDSEHCIYCKKLKNETFKDENVIKILNSYFFPIELSLDHNDEIIHYKGYELTPQSFAAGLRIRGTPTMVFLNEKSEVLTLLPGYLSADRMIPVLKYIGQRIFEKNVKFGDYLKKPIEGSYKGSEKVIELSFEDMKFVIENDPFVEVYTFLNTKDLKMRDEIKGLKEMELSKFKDKLSTLSKLKKYIFIGNNNIEELNKLGENMLSMGFPTILVYNISSNNK